MVARLDSIKDFQVVANIVPDFYQFLPRHGSFSGVLGDKHKILPVDSRDIQEGNRRSLTLSPFHLRANLLPLTTSSRKWRLRLPVLWLFRCFLPAWTRLSKPDAVTRKRFFDAL